MADDAPFIQPSIPIQYVKDSTSRTINMHPPALYPQLDLSQYVPSEGYFLTYEVHIVGEKVTPEGWDLRIEMKIDAGGWNIVYQALDDPTFNFQDTSLHKMALKHVVVDPVPGSNYQFRLAWETPFPIIVSPLKSSVQSDSTATLHLARY